MDCYFKRHQLLCIGTDGRFSAFAGRNRKHRKEGVTGRQCKRNVRRFFIFKEVKARGIKDDHPYGLSNLFIVPVFSVAAPHYIKNVLGMSSEVYGTAEGIIVLGMITGGMLISAHPGFFSMGGIQGYFI